MPGPGQLNGQILWASYGLCDGVKGLQNNFKAESTYEQPQAPKTTTHQTSVHID